MLTFGLHVHVFHHVHGPTFDYVGVALASFASWVGLAGPGEAVLLAAAVFAAKHRLDISPVVLVAWAGATLGGIVGWLVGLKAGRLVLTAPGPLRAIRLDAVAEGEIAFKRVEAVAIFLTPSWVAGINRARPGIYNFVNTLSAALWAVAIGVGGYYIGPPVVEFVDDFGTAGLVVVILLVVVGVALGIVRRHRAALRRAAGRESAP
jgi:membrane protein DedA with SNARE-associated domain